MHPANAIEIHRANSADRSAARQLQRRRAAGMLERVRHGVYVDREAWRALDARGRHLVRMRAVLPALPAGSVFSHWSAAAVLGFPDFDGFPDRVQVTCPSRSDDAYRVGLTVFAGSVTVSDTRFHGVRCADLGETAVAVARRSRFVGAVVVLDHAIRSSELDAGSLLALVRRAPNWGGARVEEALAVCDAAHESVGESFFAARAHELGVDGLEPQHEFRDADGLVDRVDFWIAALGIVIEFDGRQKPRDPAMRSGRSAEEVLWAEKRREDRIRSHAEVRGFVRVTWWHLVDPERLRGLFRQHGVPCG